MVREFVGQVLALGAQAIIGAAETDCIHRTIERSDPNFV
jgi:hypothetical protein